jgi:hypothetical protein
LPGSGHLRDDPRSAAPFLKAADAPIDRRTRAKTHLSEDLAGCQLVSVPSGNDIARDRDIRALRACHSRDITV